MLVEGVPKLSPRRVRLLLAIRTICSTPPSTPFLRRQSERGCLLTRRRLLCFAWLLDTTGSESLQKQSKSLAGVGAGKEDARDRTTLQS